MQHQLFSRKLFKVCIIACVYLIGLALMQDSWESYELEDEYQLKFYDYPFELEDAKEIFCEAIRDYAVHCLVNWVIPIARNNTPINMHCFTEAGFKSETVVDSIDEYCLSESDPNLAARTQDFLQRTYNIHCDAFNIQLKEQGYFVYFHT